MSNSHIRHVQLQCSASNLRCTARVPHKMIRSVFAVIMNLLQLLMISSATTAWPFKQIKKRVSAVT